MLDLEIIILNYNTAFWVKKCVRSLTELPPLSSHYNYKITIVDNASTDDSVDILTKEFPELTIMRQAENHGFAAGNNVALAISKARYVMLLNSDTEVTLPHTLDPLIEYLDQHHDCAVITPKVSLPTGELDWACHRGEPTLWNSFWYFTGMSKLVPGWPRITGYQRTWQDLSTIHEVDACSGAAMIVRREAMEKVGLLDEYFFMYAEDLDWCKRFRDAGYSVIFHPGAHVIHHKYKSGLSATSTQLKRKTSGYFYDTMLQYYDKHYRSHYSEVVRSCIRYILSIKKGEV